MPCPASRCSASLGSTARLRRLPACCRLRSAPVAAARASFAPPDAGRKRPGPARKSRSLPRHGLFSSPIISKAHKCCRGRSPKSWKRPGRRSTLPTSRVRKAPSARSKSPPPAATTCSCDVPNDNTTSGGTDMGLEGHVTRTTQSGLNRQSFGVKDHSQPQDTWTNQVFRPLWQCGEASGMQSEREPKAYSYTRFSTPEQAKGDSSTRQALAAQQWAEARGVELDA